MSSLLIRRTAVVVCAGGIAGMIVSSILNHNGAAITFGLITAAAVLCSMVATAVAADVTRQLTAAGAGVPGATTPAAVPVQADVAATPVTGTPVALAPATVVAVPRGAAGTPPGDPLPPAEEQAALVERLVDDVVQAGAAEPVVRELVRQSVRLGRSLAAR